jgi:hypothetical protein
MIYVCIIVCPAGALSAGLCLQQIFKQIKMVNPNNLNYACTALLTLLSFAADFVTNRHGEHAPHAAAAASARLVAPIQQQLEQSGFLRELPSILAAVNLALAGPAERHKGATLGAGDGITVKVGKRRILVKLHDLPMLANILITTQQWHTEIWTPCTANLSPWLPSALSTLELAHTPFQSIGVLVSQGLSKLSSWQRDSAATIMNPLLDLHDSAMDFVCALGECVSAVSAGNISAPQHSTPHPAAELLASSHLLPCVAIVCATLAYVRPTDLSAYDTTTDAKSSSKGGSSNGGSFNSVSNRISFGSDSSDSSDSDSDSVVIKIIDNIHISVRLSSNSNAFMNGSGITSSDGISSWQATKVLLGQLTAGQLRQFNVLGINARALLWAAQPTRSGLRNTGDAQRLRPRQSYGCHGSNAQPAAQAQHRLQRPARTAAAPARASAAAGG